jgi:hypothetical protein
MEIPHEIRARSFLKRGSAGLSSLAFARDYECTDADDGSKYFFFCGKYCLLMK